MTTTDAPVRLLSVVVNGARMDLAVPAVLPVADVVSRAGVGDDQWFCVTGSDGRQIDPGDTVGSALVDGDTLLISTDDPPPSAVADFAPVQPSAIGDGVPGDVALAAAGLATVAEVVLAVVLEHLGHPGLSAAARLTVGVVGLLTALTASLAAGRRRRPELGHAVGGLAAAAAGYSMSATAMPGHTQLAVTLAGIACAAVSAIGRSAAAARTEVASVLLCLSVAVAIAFGATLQAGGGVAVPAALLLGLIPAAYRLLPSYSIDVPDEQLLDVDRLSVTAWAARTTRRPASRRIRLTDIQETVGHAQRLVSTAAVALAVLAAVLGGVVLGAAGTGLPRLGAAIEIVLVAIALGLLPRSARSALDKGAPRLAAAVALLELALFVAERGSAQVATLSAAALLGTGLVALISATALAGGWLSVRGSRLADAAESLCVVLALPAALIAVDAIATFRQLTSG